ncbi:MAG: universal stress protein [Promethearchaeota archaeon]
MAWKRILVAFDGSEHAMWALDEAIELAKQDKSKIIIYYAIKHSFRTVKPALFPFFSSNENDSMGLDPATEALVYKSHKDIAERILKEAVEKLKGTGLDYETELVENSNPVEAAVELVGSHNIDLVVVGAKGIHGALERLVLGSVSTGIVNKVCSANVLVIRTACSA